MATPEKRPWPGRSRIVAGVVIAGTLAILTGGLLWMGDGAAGDDPPASQSGSAELGLGSADGSGAGEAGVRPVSTPSAGDGETIDAEGTKAAASPSTSVQGAAVAAAPASGAGPPAEAPVPDEQQDRDQDQGERPASLVLDADGITALLSEPGLDLSDPETRARVVADMRLLGEGRDRLLEDKARELGIPMEIVDEDGRVLRLVDFEGDRPRYLSSRNANAAISTAADLVRSTSPYHVDGSGYVFGLWEVGGVPRSTHVEFANPAAITIKNSINDPTNHATHVAGTLLARGAWPQARGMAPQSLIDAYGIDNDLNQLFAELTAAGAAAPHEPGMVMISNHSYGFILGWDVGAFGRHWYGNFSPEAPQSDHVDPGFGRYDQVSQILDSILANQPYHLPFFAAGNDRDDVAPAADANWAHQQGNNITIYSYDPDQHPLGDDVYKDGYDLVDSFSTAKNVITIGAVNDAVLNGVRDVSMGTLSSFTSTGPADDGRIKPDVVANGVLLTSPINNGGDNAYGISSGTSMAAPNAAGSAMLLVDLYERRFPGQAMRSNTLKGLIIHTADDRGTPGPNYQYGWGLMNTLAAAELIEEHAAQPDNPRIIEDTLTQGGSRSFTLHSDGQSEIKVTLTWLDPPGPWTNAHDSRTPRLVNDLNLRVIDPENVTHLPFVMPYVGDWSNAMLAAPAARGVNTVDNVEQVLIDAPPAAGTYNIVVDHAGPLQNGAPQAFSLLISGAAGGPAVTTAEAADVTETSATLGGSVSWSGTVTGRGVVYDTEPAPTLGTGVDVPAGAGAGSFTVPVTGLEPVTTYHARAYATTGEGTTYGATVTFTTGGTVITAPTVTTQAAVDVTETSATLGGNVTDEGGAAVTARGVVYATSPNPTLDTGTNLPAEPAGPGAFSVQAGGLAPGTTYHARAYATNSQGTSYGATVSFTTLAQRTLTLIPNPAEGGGVSGGGTFLQGTFVTAQASPAQWHVFERWREGGATVSTNAQYSFTLEGDRTLVADFARIHHPVNVSASPVAGGEVSGGGSLPAGLDTTVTAVANNHYQFVRWQEGGNTVSTSAAYTFHVIEPRDLVAEFALIPYDITVTASPADGGQVSGGGSYGSGTMATVQAVPAEHFEFVSWTENGTVVSQSASYGFQVTDNRDLVANFQRQTWQINLSASPAQGGSVSGGGEVDSGTSVTVVASPAQFYQFVRWTEGGNQVSTDASYSFTATGNRALVAEFEQFPIDITVIANPPDGGTLSGGGGYNGGSTADLLAVPTEYFDFVRWRENDNTVSTQPNFSFTVTEDRVLTADFLRKQYEVTVEASPVAGGQVAGAGTRGAGLMAEVSATPAPPDFQFARWLKDGVEAGAEPVLEFLVTGDHHLVAEFERIPYDIDLAVTPLEGGQVTGGGPQPSGEPTTVTAIPAEFFRFIRWTEGDTTVSTDEAYTFTVSEARSLVAEFERIPYEVTAAVDPPEGGLVTGAGTWPAGLDATVVAEAAEFYRFVRWTEDGAEVSTSESYTFQVTENHHLVAEFERIPYQVTVSLSPSTGGQVSGGGTWEAGLDATVVAEAADFYQFVRWTVNGAEVSTSESYTFQVTENRHLVAEFERIPYEVTVSASPPEGGQVSGAGTRLAGLDTTVVATEAEFFRFVRWTEDGAEVSTSESYTFQVTEDHDLVAEFERIPYQITVAASPPEGGQVSGAGTRLAGLDTTVVATEAEFFRFVRWSQGGAEVSTDESYTFQVTQDHHLVAEFERIPYQITVAASPPEGGQVSGAGTRLAGLDTTVVAEAAEFYQFVRWTEGGLEVSADESYTFQVTEDHDLVAEFERIPYEVTVSAEPAEGGQVSGAGTRLAGLDTTVVATEAEFFRFVRWSQGGAEVSTDVSYTFQVTEDHHLVAEFERIPYQITVAASPPEGGQVSGAGTRLAGLDTTVVAEAAEFYRFVRWTEGGLEVSTSASYTFQVTEDHDLVAEFERIPYEVTVSAEPAEGGQVSGAGTRLAGLDATVNAEPAQYFRFVRWLKDGVAAAATPEFTFQVTGDHVLVAEFERIPYQIDLAADPEEGGSVGGGGILPAGLDTTVTAEPAQYFQFVRWLENGQPVSSDPAYTFLVEEPRDLVAEFERIPLEIVVSATPAGAGAVTGGGVLPAGLDTEVTAQPAEGYRFVRWMEDFNGGQRPVRHEGQPFIPDGPFLRGDSNGEGNADELPQREILVDGLFISETEVTLAQWNEVRDWAVTNGYPDLPEGQAQSADHPVHSVSWHDAVKWSNARTEWENEVGDTSGPLTPVYSAGGQVYRSGQTDSVTMVDGADGFRLPTESEWEKAARGGVDGLRFAGSNSIDHSQANFRNEGGESYQTGQTGPHPAFLPRPGESSRSAPARSFGANALGLYEVTGNMREWCWDWHAANAYTLPETVNPAGPVTGTQRVLRGGGWDGTAAGVRVAARGQASPTTTSNDIGFRIARAAVGVEQASEDVVYAFQVVDERRLVAVFEPVMHVIAATPAPFDKGFVDGGGAKQEGSTATLAAEPVRNHGFTGWHEDGVLVSADDEFTFQVMSARQLTAEFELLPEAELTIERPAGQAVTPTEAAHEFGEVVLGSTGGPVSYTIHNTGGQFLEDIDIRFAATGMPDEFVIDVSEVPHELAGGESATFTVSFAPQFSLPRDAVVEVRSHVNPDQPFLIEVSGTGVFGDRNVAVSNPQDIDLTPLGGEVLGIQALPPGLRFDRAAQSIVGTPLRPRADGQPYVARALVEYPDGSREWIDLTLDIEPLPSWAPGLYTGYVEVSDPADPEGLFGRGGEVTLRVTPTGLYTGQLRLGFRVFGLRGNLQGFEGQTDPDSVLTASLNLRQVLSDPSQDFTLEIELEEGAQGVGLLAGAVVPPGVDPVDGLALTGWQSPWQAFLNPAWGGANGVRVHTIMSAIDAPGAGEAFPGGNGFAIVTLLRNGTARVQTTLADGGSLAGVARVSAEGELHLYRHRYRGGGAVLLRLQADDPQGIPAELAGDLRWTKFADTRERDYNTGFDLFTGALGRPHTRPALGQFLFSESATQPGWLGLQLSGLGIEDEDILTDYQSQDQTRAEIPLRLNERNAIINDPQAPGRARAVLSPVSGLAQGNILLPRVLANGRQVNLNTTFRGLYLPGDGAGEPGRVHGFFQQQHSTPTGFTAQRRTGVMAIEENQPDAGDDLLLVQGGVLSLALGETGGEVLSVQGLPPGVRFDRQNQRLTGLVRFPTTAIAVVRLPDGSRVAIEIALDFEPLPGWLPGLYVGPVEVIEPGHDGLLGKGGEIRVSVTPRGQYSGQLRLGARVFGVRGVLQDFDGRIDPDDEQLSAANNIRPVLSDASQDLQLELLFENGPGDVGQLSGIVSGQGDQLAITGWRNIWQAFLNPAWGGVNGTRVHTIIDWVDEPGAGEDFPGGFSYAVVTLLRSGQAQIQLSLADGVNTAGVGQVSAEGVFHLYRPLYRGSGAIQLQLQADEVNAVPARVLGDLRWLKRPDARERDYAGGFDLESPALGRPYVRPPAGQFLFTDDGSEPQDLVWMLGGLGIEDEVVFADFNDGEFVVVPLAVDALSRPVLAAEVPTVITLPFNPNSGLLGGIFRLDRTWESGRVGAFSVSQRGLYLPPGPDDGRGPGIYGHFLKQEDGFNGPAAERKGGAMVILDGE